MTPNHIKQLAGEISDAFDCKNEDNRPISCTECPLGSKVDNNNMSVCIVLMSLYQGNDRISYKEWEVQNG